MKLFGKKKSGAVAALEGEIDALTKRRDALQTKFDASANLLDLARIDRRNFLINGDDADAAAAQKFDAAIAASDRDVTALRDALTEIDSRLTDARQRLEMARDGDEREQRAAAWERAADDISKRAAALEAATDALAIALSDFTKAIPDDIGLVMDHSGFAPNSPATAAQLAAAIVGQGLCMTAPDLFETRRPPSRVLRPAGVERALIVRTIGNGGKLSNFLPGHQGEEVEILPTRLAAQHILVEPLRQRASALRDSADLAQAAE